MHLFIAGPDEGNYKIQLNQMIRQLEIECNITFTGMVLGEKKSELLAAADIFVLTSHQEGDSMAVKEAMAAALPVIITPACHFSEVESSQSGFVVFPAIEEILQTLKRIALDEHRKDMGIRGKSLIVKSYTWEKIIGQLMDKYESVCNNHIK